MKIAVTGAEGQLGTELCRQLGGDAVGLELPDFDLSDPDRVVDTLLGLRPDAVINAAAYTLVDKAELEPDVCRRVNVEAVMAIVDACRALDAPLVQVSTDYVFSGAGRRLPYRETDEPSPLGVYATSKLQSEQEATRWQQHLIVRTCGLYGHPGKRGAGNFVRTMLELARGRNTIRVVGDQRCTPTCVPHAARAILFLLRVHAQGIYHVVNGGDTTWHEFAKEIFRLSGLDPPVEQITSAQYGARAPRPSYSVLDTTKYRSLPGYPIMPPWRDALAEYLLQ